MNNRLSTLNERVLTALTEVMKQTDDDTPAATVHVQAAPYVTVALAATITGLSAKAINVKIDEGVWLEGREWRRGPDGRRYVSLDGYRRWCERGRG